MHSLEFDQPSANDADQENLEILLFLLDKFCASDELYHELPVFSKGLPTSYLIKQKRNELNKVCHIERTPGQPAPRMVHDFHFLQLYKPTLKQFLESNYLRELPVNHNEAEVPENNLIEDEYNRVTVNQL